MEKKEDPLSQIEEKSANWRLNKSENDDDGFSSIPGANLAIKESNSVTAQIENLIEKTKLVSLGKDEDRQEMDKCLNEDKRSNNNYFRKRFSINQQKSNYFNAKPKETKKDEVRPTPSNELKNRLDFRTRIPTIVDDVYLNRGNNLQRHKANTKPHGHNLDKKFDKSLEKNEKLDILVTKDFNTSSRQVSLNNEKNTKTNRSSFGPKQSVDNCKDGSRTKKNLPQILTPPLTPSSSKFDPPPGLPLPNNVNQNYADKEYAAAIAAFLLSNPIFCSNGAELAHLSNSGSQKPDSKLN